MTNTLTLSNFWEVGGAVRDSLLHRPNKDVDFAVECAGHLELAGWLAVHGYEVFEFNERCLTFRARPPKDAAPGELPGAGQVVDFAVARRDGAYSDGRHPDEVTPGTIHEDLARRDFTVNAIARNFVTGELLDPHGGVRDLEQSVLRTVGSPTERMAEDGLRAVRALRFAVTHRLDFDRELWRTITGETVLALLVSDAVPAERISQELRKAFAHDTIATYRLLSQLPTRHQEALFKDGLRLMPTMKQRM